MPGGRTLENPSFKGISTFPDVPAQCIPHSVIGRLCRLHEPEPAIPFGRPPPNLVRAERALPVAQPGVKFRAGCKESFPLSEAFSVCKSLVIAPGVQFPHVGIRAAKQFCVERRFFGVAHEQKHVMEESRIIMSTLQMKGNWNIIKGRLKQRWARLTDDDLQFVEGKESELIGRIQKRTGESHKQVESVLEESCSSCSSRE